MNFLLLSFTQEKSKDCFISVPFGFPSPFALLLYKERERLHLPCTKKRYKGRRGRAVKDNFKVSRYF